MTHIPLDAAGKPQLWYLHLNGAITKGQAVAAYSGDWGDQPRRICLEMDFDFSLFFPGGKPMMFDAMRRNVDTNYFMYGGLFDEFRGQQIPGNFFAGAQIRIGGPKWYGIVVTTVQILRAIDAKTWLWIAPESEPRHVVEIARAIKPKWIIWEPKTTAFENLQIISAAIECDSLGAVSWINLNPSDFRAMMPTIDPWKYYRAPKGIVG